MTDPRDLEVRRLGPDEASLLAEAERLFHPAVAGAEALDRFLADPSRHYVVALRGARVLGRAFAYELPRVKRDATELLLYEVDVVEEARRQGVGTALVRALLRIAAARGVDEVWVPTNASNRAACALYLRCGGTPSGGDDVVHFSLRPTQTPTAEA